MPVRGGRRGSARSSPAGAGAPGAGRSPGRRWRRTRWPARRPPAARRCALVRGSQGSTRIARSCSFCCSNSLTISSPRRAEVRQWIHRGLSPGAVIAEAVIFHLLRRAVVPLAAAVLGRLPLDQEPSAGQLADRGVDDDLVGQRDRDAMLDDPERRPACRCPGRGSGNVRDADSGTAIAADGGRCPGTRGKKTRGVMVVAPGTVRSTGMSESSTNKASAAYHRRPFSRHSR